MLRLRESNEMLALDLLPNLFLHATSKTVEETSLWSLARNTSFRMREVLPDKQNPSADELLEHLVGGFPLRGVLVHVPDGFEERQRFARVLLAQSYSALRARGCEHCGRRSRPAGGA